ncbi:hypothetical protein [Amycolatopsis tolypomycina]|uniref:DUF3558 domain-containing protein n=1 Tax=Amycolatopsis tolypomycina TaxID=208445 RepID=A0A1H4NWK6_9PSEU|nr:hypothetical protein [Amycolatopsis tolypomycina]SEB31768.1 hypothetical protein SAMN04489727_0328 [Amycolatopsis tolypomycina]SEB99637.1 hypothetical protein SAMN04489727_2177 [Amycolatopsis tolypomycina]
MTAAGPSRRRWFVRGAALAAVVLVTALAVVSRPWLEAWWPGRHEAATLPGTCPRLPGLPPGSPARLTGPGDVQGADCAWAGPPEVEARYSLYRRTGNQSGTGKAEQEAASRVTRYDGPSAGYRLGADTPVSGVGDEARISAHGSLVVLVARKSNVVLVLDRTSAPGEGTDQAEAAITGYARTLLDLVELS